MISNQAPKPIAWIGPRGELMTDDVFKAWAADNWERDAPRAYKPLYLQPIQSESATPARASPPQERVSATPPRKGRGRRTTSDATAGEKVDIGPPPPITVTIDSRAERAVIRSEVRRGVRKGLAGVDSKRTAEAVRFAWLRDGILSVNRGQDGMMFSREEVEALERFLHAGLAF